MHVESERGFPHRGDIERVDYEEICWPLPSQPIEGFNVKDALASSGPHIALVTQHYLA